MKLVVGFINYNESTAKYLPYFLPSLKKALDFAFGHYEAADSYKVIAFDNSDNENNENSAYIKENFPDFTSVYSGKNLGFAGAYNLIIARAVKFKAEYFLMINPDTILAEDSILKMIELLDFNKKLGAVAPRILKWDFSSLQKTDFIDSDGITMAFNHHAFDSNQGLSRIGLPEINSFIFGFTGAAALIRVTALEDVAFNIFGRLEYLDELMFMYKEDIDLSYRLQLAAWPIMLCPKAIIYHDRSASSLGRGLRQIINNRKNKSRRVREWSFLNQWIIVCRYLSLPWSLAIKFKILFHQLVASFFVMIFEPGLLRQLFLLISYCKEIKLKSCQLKLKIDLSEIEKILIK